MKVREVELKAQRLGTRKLKMSKVKETWDVVKFGEKEFVMPKKSK